MTLIHLENVSHRWGRRAALSHVTLDVRKREYLAVVGPAASGKSTLLRLLAGRTRPTLGGISHDGTNLRTEVQFVTQYMRRPRFGSVARCLGHRSGTPCETLTALDLAALLDRPVRHLSHAQWQRVVIARAVLQAPKLLILDMAMSAFGSPERARLGVALRDLCRTRSMTIVHATADMQIALNIADRVAVLSVGALDQVAPPLLLLDHPSTAQVARCVGHPVMNLLEGTVSGGVFRADGAVIEGIDAPDGPVIIGFRAGDIDLMVEEMGFTGCEVTGALIASEHFAGTQVARLSVNGADVRVQVPNGFSAAQGTRLRVIVPPDVCHVFDGRTGRRHSGPGPMLLA